MWSAKKTLVSIPSLYECCETCQVQSKWEQPSESCSHVTLSTSFPMVTVQGKRPASLSLPTSPLAAQSRCSAWRVRSNVCLCTATLPLWYSTSSKSAACQRSSQKSWKRITSKMQTNHIIKGQDESDHEQIFRKHTFCPSLTISMYRISVLPTATWCAVMWDDFKQHE